MDTGSHRVRRPATVRRMILRDPVHGLVSFEAPESCLVPRLLDAREVQRLRRIRQLGLTSLAFPGAEHTRFAHAIGAAHVMTLLLERLRSIEHMLPVEHRITPRDAREAVAAAFLHDVGHGPLSHLFEESVPGLPKHEHWTDAIVRDPGTDVHRILEAQAEGTAERVAALVRGEHRLPYLAHSVSGLFDIDRCDYLLRDAHATGVRYGDFDLPWLLRSLLVHDAPHRGPELAIDGAKGLPAIEAFLIARLFMFQQVYLHKATRAAEWMVRAVIRRAVEQHQQGHTPDHFPAALREAALGTRPTLGAYLELDDAWLTTAMHAWERDADPILSNLCARLRSRALFKTLEIFGEDAKPTRMGALLAHAQTVVREAGGDETYDVHLDEAIVVPFNEPSDDPMMVLFAKGPARPLREVSFLLERIAGASIRRVRVVMAPEHRDRLVAALRSEGGPPA
jgi:HD superfamily phosphohydrolase